MLVSRLNGYHYNNTQPDSDKLLSGSVVLLILKLERLSLMKQLNAPLYVIS